MVIREIFHISLAMNTFSFFGGTATQQTNGINKLVGVDPKKSCTHKCILLSYTLYIYPESVPMTFLLIYSSKMHPLPKQKKSLYKQKEEKVVIVFSTLRLLPAAGTHI